MHCLRKLLLHVIIIQCYVVVINYWPHIFCCQKLRSEFGVGSQYVTVISHLGCFCQVISPNHILLLLIF